MNVDVAAFVVADVPGASDAPRAYHIARVDHNEGFRSRLTQPVERCVHFSLFSFFRVKVRDCAPAYLVPLLCEKTEDHLSRVRSNLCVFVPLLALEAFTQFEAHGKRAEGFRCERFAEDCVDCMQSRQAQL